MYSFKSLVLVVFSMFFARISFDIFSFWFDIRFSWFTGLVSVRPYLYICKSPFGHFTFFYVRSHLLSHFRSTIGRIGLNRRVRDGNGCLPDTHRHGQKILIASQSNPDFPRCSSLSLFTDSLGKSFFQFLISMSNNYDNLTAVQLLT